MSTRAAITSAPFPMVNAVIAGIGLIIVLSVCVLATHAMALLPAVIVLSAVLSAPVLWMRALPIRICIGRGYGGRVRRL